MVDSESGSGRSGVGERSEVDQPEAVAADAPVAAPRAEDGRRSRWTEHRRVRREEFIGAAVSAVRLTGPDFSVDDVARVAGVSKTVLYRYFADKDELVDAVLDRIAQTILLPRLMGEMAQERGEGRDKMRAVVGAFVELIVAEPALYRFAYAHTGRAGGADLVAATEREVAETLTVLFAQLLRDSGRSPEAAGTWAYGVVGMVQLSAHWWASTRHVPAPVLVEQLTALAWEGLAVLLPSPAGPDTRAAG